MDADFEQMLAQAQGARARGGDSTVPDKYVLKTCIFSRAYLVLQWRGDPYILPCTLEGGPVPQLRLDMALTFLKDVKARTRRRAYGSHGSDVGGIYRRIYRPGYRRICNAAIRNNGLCGISRPCLPDEDDGNAEADRAVSTPYLLKDIRAHKVALVLLDRRQS